MTTLGHLFPDDAIRLGEQKSFFQDAAPPLPPAVVSIKRSEKFGSAALPLYPDTRAQVGVYPYDITGALSFSEPVALFDEFLLQSIAETNKDIVQFINGSDAPKMYSLGQGHRLFSMTAIILDTDLNRTLNTSNTLPAQTDAESQLLRFKGWSGAGLNAWQVFYKTFANIESCSKNRRLVKFQYSNRTFYGAFTGSNLSHSSILPHQYELVAAFYAVHVDNF